MIFFLIISTVSIITNILRYRYVRTKLLLSDVDLYLLQLYDLKHNVKTLKPNKFIFPSSKQSPFSFFNLNVSYLYKVGEDNKFRAKFMLTSISFFLRNDLFSIYLLGGPAPNPYASADMYNQHYNQNGDTELINLVSNF